MNTALDLIEAHPASRATAFAVSCARARLATDRTIAAVVQWIVRDFVLSKVSPNRFVAPVSHRIELNDVVARAISQSVQFDDAYIGAGM